jgi:hypothetical protein
MNREIRVALPVALFRISETRVPHYLPVHLFLFPKWKWTKRLGQHLHTVDADGYFAGAGTEEWAMNADDVAQIEMGELCVTLLAKLIFLEIELDLPRCVGQMCERRLSM